MNPQTLLLDMDGTLIDSEAIASRAVEEGFREWGMTIAPEDARLIHGRTWALAFQLLTAKYTMPLPEAEALRFLFAKYRTLVEQEVVPIPGVPDQIHHLAKHYEVVIVSGSSRSEIQWTLERLELDHVIKQYWGAEDYFESKPSPVPFLTAARGLKREVQDCLIFEDSDAGICSALAAKIPVVAVTHAHRAEESLLRQAVAVVPDFRIVTQDWINQLAPSSP